MTVVRINQNENKDEIYNRIDVANKSLAPIKVKDKDYIQVNQRIKAFRYVYPKGKIETKIISLDGDIGKRICLMRCEIFDDLGNLIATGYAEEKEDSTFINKTSFIENCETSCVGRALGMCGFGIDTSIASAEEVETAIANQDTKKPTFNKLSSFAIGYSDDERKQIRNHYGVEKDDDLPRDVVDKYVKERKDIIKAEIEKQSEQWKNVPLTDKGNPFYQ